MKNLYIIRIAEAFLKGKNKFIFEDKLILQIERASGKRPKKNSGLLVLEANFSEVLTEKLLKIFGIASISLCKSFELKTGDNLFDDIAENVAETFRLGGTFKVETKRRDKSFPLNSIECSREIGAKILSFKPELKVDVNNPEKTIYIEIRKGEYYLYDEILKGAGGLPYGTSGRGLSLLSGGIDSPVSSYLIAKRGMKLSFLHFHSYPYTNERAKDKVIKLAKILAGYLGKIELHIMNILPYQEEARKHINEKNMTLHTRRAMIFLADRLANFLGVDAIINGESLGQVASQTAEAIKVTDSATTFPIYRPLISYEKTEIIEIGRKIGTFETSILPYEDCCTVFLPKHPNTRPVLKEIEEEEKLFSGDAILDKIFEERELIKIDQ